VVVPQQIEKSTPTQFDDVEKNLASWGMSEKYLSSDDGCSRSAARHQQMTNLQQKAAQGSCAAIIPDLAAAEHDKDV